MITKAAVLCLALNVYHEARGEPLEGQHAVAHVTINRAKERKTTVCQEVYRAKQFSWTINGKERPLETDKSWLSSIEIAKMALVSKDVINGATYFYNTKIGDVSCITKNRVRVKKIGHHTFFKNNK